MDGSDQKSISSSSNSNKHRPPIPIDENGKMMMTSKHFMSPTISAASKFNPSRKKILVERNESVDNNLPKTPNLDSKRVEKETNSDPNHNSGVWKAVSGDSSSSKPYDPLTNYLSPRPRFLRYDPNRRRQILLRSGNEEKQGENEEADCASSCDSLAQPQGGDDEIDEIDCEYEKEEEEDDERGCWSFRGVFKVLMLWLVLVVSTLYISSMNSPTPPSSSFNVVVAVPGIRDGYHCHMMQDHGYEYANQTFLRFEREEESIVELDGGQIQGFSNSEVTEEENEEGEGEVDEKIVEEEEEIIELDGGRIEGFSDSAVEGEVVETFNEAIEGEKIVEEEEIVELADGGKIPDSSNSEVSETVDELEKEGFVEESIKEGIFEGERGRIGNITEGGSEMIKGIETESVLKAAIGFSMVFFLSSIIASMTLLRRFQSRKSRNAREKKNTSPPVVPEPCFEPAEPIESGGGAAAHFGISETMSLFNSMEEEASSEATQGRSIRSLSHGSYRKSLVDSMEEEASREEYLEFIRSLSHESRAAPVIELLGELELSEMSTSLRSCGVGTKNSSRVIENEVSSSHSKTISYPARVSIFDSPSYPDQKTQQPMKKKKEGDATITPVRRSSRIRNRAFSP